jgi:hypothetical protein
MIEYRKTRFGISWWTMQCYTNWELGLHDGSTVYLCTCLDMTPSTTRMVGHFVVQSEGN